MSNSRITPWSGPHVPVLSVGRGEASPECLSLCFSSGSSLSSLFGESLGGGVDSTLNALSDATADLAADAYSGTFDAIASLLDTSVSAVNSALDSVDKVVVSTTQKDLTKEGGLGDIF